MDDVILDEVILKGEATNPGPEMDTVYIPGTSGAAWTEEEVKYTRLSKMIISTLTYHSLCRPCYAKGQLISKANCQAVNSFKKRTNEFALLVCNVFSLFFGRN